MRLPRRTPRTRHTDMVDVLKRRGPMLVALPAIVVAVIVGFLVHRVMVSDFGEVFAAGMSATISEAWNTGGFRVDRDGEAFRHFDEMIEGRVDRGRVTAVRVQQLDGTVVYSTNAEEIGSVIPLEGSALEASEHGTISTTVTSSHALLSDGRASNVLVIGPVQLGGEAQIAGVFTALKPYSAIQPSIRVSVLSVVAVVLAGAMATYSFLRLLVARTERELAAGRAQVEHVNLRLGRSLSEMEHHLMGTLHTLNAAVDAKDRYTARHSLNVADYACALGAHIGMEDDMRILERAGLLHDIGKIGVPEAILQKSGPLSDEEYHVVQRHSRIGATMIETIPFLSEIVPAVEAHHEWWNGNGYPEGLSGEQIPMVARVLMVVDAFDAMTTSRPYRDAMALAEARAELVRGRGTQFDPEIVDAFIELVDAGGIVVHGMRFPN